jgi:hypothetical protein
MKFYHQNFNSILNPAMNVTAEKFPEIRQSPVISIALKLFQNMVSTRLLIEEETHLA